MTKSPARNRQDVANVRNRMQQAYELAKLLFQQEYGLTAMPYRYDEFDEWLKSKLDKPATAGKD